MTTEQIKKFLKGGRATFTLQSTKTGQHYTFKATMPKDPKPGALPLWINVLHNVDQYTYLGTIWVGVDGSWKYSTTKASPVSHKLHKVMGWWVAVLDQDKHAKDLVFRHAGVCSRCGRKLTTPESVDSGLGPVCAGRVA